MSKISIEVDTGVVPKEIEDEDLLEAVKPIGYHAIDDGEKERQSNMYEISNEVPSWTEQAVQKFNEYINKHGALKAEKLLTDAL